MSANTDTKREVATMENNWNYIDILLRHSFPEEGGWSMELNQLVGDFELDYIFQRGVSETVLVQCMDGVYVKGDDIKLADGVKREYDSSHTGRSTKVILMYGKLLFRPKKLPSNVIVVSAIEEPENVIGSNSNQCLN